MKIQCFPDTDTVYLQLTVNEMRKPKTTPDQFFTASQIQRLATLMQCWRTALNLGQELPITEQTELEELVEAEVLAAANRALAMANDETLLRASQTTLSLAQRERLEALHHKLQRQGLTEAERTEEASLEQLYRDVILMRAQAAIMLQQRNYDISDPSHFIPPESQT